jgi:hypothetical protein
MRSRDEALRRVMPDRLRHLIYLGFGALWATGCGWLVLHYFAASRGEFGIVRHPLEGPLLLAHGVLAIAIAYLSAWIIARHASESWRNGKRRLSGGALTGVLAVLSVSGFALFFVASDAWQTWTARLHDVLGVAITLFAIEHWRLVGQNGE